MPLIEILFSSNTRSILQMFWESPGVCELQTHIKPEGKSHSINATLQGYC